MFRRSLLVLGLGCCFGSMLAGGQPGGRPNVLVMDSASAGPNLPYTVKLEVTVENRGSRPSPPGMVEVTMRPRVASGSRPKSSEPTMFDPLTDSQPFPPLQPSERKTLTFTTPYQANSPFKNMRGSFKTNNIDPTGGDVTVQVTTKLTLPPTP